MKNEEKREDVVVTFKDVESGKSIDLNVSYYTDSQEIDLELDFGEVGAKDHTGLYVHLVQVLTDTITGKDAE